MATVIFCSLNLLFRLRLGSGRNEGARYFVRWMFRFIVNVLALGKEVKLANT
jgi:hypothetical protein